MAEWIVIVVLYVLALAFFRFLGGFGGAGDAIRDWSESRSASRVTPGSSSS